MGALRKLYVFDIDADAAAASVHRVLVSFSALLSIQPLTRMYRWNVGGGGQLVWVNSLLVFLCVYYIKTKSYVEFRRVFRHREKEDHHSCIVGNIVGKCDVVFLVGTGWDE